MAAAVETRRVTWRRQINGKAPPGIGIGVGGSSRIGCPDLPIIGGVAQAREVHAGIRSVILPCAIACVVVDRVIAILIT